MSLPCTPLIGARAQWGDEHFDKLHSNMKVAYIRSVPVEQKKKQTKKKTSQDVDSFKVLDDKLDWSSCTTTIYKKGQCDLNLLRRLRSFRFSMAVVASAVSVLGEWSHGQGREEAGQTCEENRLGPGLSTGRHPGGDGQRMLAKLATIMDNTSAYCGEPELSSSFSSSQ